MRTKVDFTIEDIYKAYIKANGVVDKRDFKKVLYLTNKLISHYIVNRGLTVALPYRLGSLSVRKKKMEFSKLHFDYAEYNKTGIKSYHLNPHSDEFYATAYWEKSKAIVKNKVAYRLDLTRQNKRDIASIMQEPNGHQIYEMYK
jgi:hypothetical protein